MCRCITHGARRTSPRHDTTRLEASWRFAMPSHCRCWCPEVLLLPFCSCNHAMRLCQMCLRVRSVLPTKRRRAGLCASRDGLGASQARSVATSSIGSRQHESCITHPSHSRTVETVSGTPCSALSAGTSCTAARGPQGHSLPQFILLGSTTRDHVTMLHQQGATLFTPSSATGSSDAHIAAWAQPPHTKKRSVSGESGLGCLTLSPALVTAAVAAYVRPMSDGGGAKTGEAGPLDAQIWHSKCLTY